MPMMTDELKDELIETDDDIEVFWRNDFCVAANGFDGIRSSAALHFLIVDLYELRKFA